MPGAILWPARMTKRDCHSRICLHIIKSSPPTNDNRGKSLQYDKNQHRLLRDIAHRARLTPDEYDQFQKSVRAAKIPFTSVNIPEWPPVPYSPLLILFGSKPWWEERYWTGKQPSVKHADSARASRIAREMAGDPLSPRRLAYAWQVPEYDPREHIILRYWLDEHDLSIVDFLRDYLPAVEKRLGRDDLLIEVTNPRAQQEQAEGSYSPTRRAVRIADRSLLDNFAVVSPRFTYDTDLHVSWVRAEDDSRWEARRTHLPQSDTWASHRSWIMRPLGQGALRDDDVDPVDGHRFGPAMELFDDGMLWVWVARRALDHVSSIAINGVDVELTAQTFGPTCRMVGHVSLEQMPQIVGEPYAREVDSANTPATPDATGPIILNDVQFTYRSPFYRAKTGLPDQFHRPKRCRLVLREPDLVRVFGDEAISRRGLVINGVAVTDLKPHRGGWQGRLAAPCSVVARNGNARARATSSRTTSPVAGVNDGAITYSPAAVVDPIEAALGRSVRLFGQTTSDKGIVALTRSGLEQFLAEDSTDRLDYIADHGGRNYDCENFSETLRTNLARKYGVNGCAVIWGDSHAWCLFVLVGNAGPTIAMVEPQADTHVPVNQLTGPYSIDHRAEVLL